MIHLPVHLAERPLLSPPETRHQLPVIALRVIHLHIIQLYVICSSATISANSIVGTSRVIMDVLGIQDLNL